MAMFSIYTTLILTIFFPIIQSSDILGEIYAFADVNYDRFTDLIVKRKNNLVVYKSITNEKDLKFTEKTDFVEDRDYTQDFSNFGDIENVAVADFNGDSFPDLLVTTREADSDIYFASICWGTLTTFNPCDNKRFIFKEQPIIMNCDDDAYSDIFGIIPNNSRVCYTGHSSMHTFGSFLMPMAPNNKSLLPKAAQAFVDITGDLNADLVLAVTDPDWQNGKTLPEFEVWTRNGPGISWNYEPVNQIPRPPLDLLVGNSSMPPSLFPLNKDSKFTIGQIIFDDFNRDGSPDLLMPVCIGTPKTPCQNFRLAIWSGDHRRWFWITVGNMPSTGGVLFTHIDPSSFIASALTVRSGDFTQNGYPDLLVVMTGSKKDTTNAYLINNIECGSKDPASLIPLDCADFGRSFSLSINQLAGCAKVTTAAWFDLKEDGALDVLFDCLNETLGAVAGHSIQFATSKADQDTTFLKLQAYTPACGSMCPNEKEGTGISLPGAAFVYTMQDSEGRDISATCTQQSRTSHRSLLLPYALFGLGRTPNFVDRLTLGIPQWIPNTQSWPQLVPNSRMYVIPWPGREPGHWAGRLYVTPNRLVLLSAAALGGVCLLIGLTVILLHCCEMRQDRKERDVLKKRFHFDAM